MDLKKQMEMDLEELQERLEEVKERIKENNDSDWCVTSEDCDYSEIFGKIDLIKKYLKYFENDMVVEVGEKYRLKKDKLLVHDGVLDINDEFSMDIDLMLDEKEEVYVENIELYNEERNIVLVNFTSIDNNSWGIDIDSFKYMFEEVKNDN